MSLRTLWLGPAAVAVAVLFAAPAVAQHGPGGFHAGGFHAGSFHAAGMHPGAFHAGGFPAGVPLGGLNTAGFHARSFHHGGIKPGAFPLGGINGGAAPLGGGMALPGLAGTGLNDDEPEEDALPGDSAPPAAEPPPAEMPPDAPGRVASPALPPSVDNAAHLTVRVRADAELRFNGVPMHTTGPVREFVSPALIPGVDYSYQVHASWFEGGRAIHRTRKVQVRANLQLEVDLTQAQPGDMTGGS